MDIYGLGITIEYVDKGALAGITRVHGALSGLMGLAGNTSASVSKSAKDMDDAFSSLKMFYAGQQATEFGKTIIGSMTKAGGAIAEAGSKLEQYRITFTSLYKDADLAEQKIQEIYGYAAKTPFDTESLMPVVIGLKSMGLEATETVTSVDGLNQSLLSFIGDLKTMRGISMDKIMTGIRNAFGGNVRSLEAQLDVPVEDLLGRKLASGNAQQFAQDIADLTAALGVGGVMAMAEGSWEQRLSNMREMWTLFITRIADNGIMDSLSKTAGKVTDFVSEMLANGDFEKTAKAAAEAIKTLLKILDDVTTKVLEFVKMGANWIKDNPDRVAGFLKLTAAIGAGAIAIGTFLKFAGTFGIFLTGLNSLSGSLPAAIKMLGKFGLVTGVAALAWTNDFAGIKTTVTGAMNAIGEGIGFGMQALEGFTGDLKALENSNDPFANLKRQAGLATVVLQGISEILRGDSLEADTFFAAQELGVIDLLSWFQNTKWAAEQFFSGLEDGFMKAVDGIKGILEGILGMPLEDWFSSMGFDAISDWLSGKGWNMDAAYEIGAFIGEFGVYALGVEKLTSALGGLSKVLFGSGGGSLLGGLSGAAGGVGGLTGLFTGVAGILSKIHPLLGAAIAAVVVLAEGMPAYKMPKEEREQVIAETGKDPRNETLHAKISELTGVTDLRYAIEGGQEKANANGKFYGDLDDPTLLDYADQIFNEGIGGAWAERKAKMLAADDQMMFETRTKRGQNTTLSPEEVAEKFVSETTIDSGEGLFSTTAIDAFYTKQLSLASGVEAALEQQLATQEVLDEERILSAARAAAETDAYLSQSEERARVWFTNYKSQVTSVFDLMESQGRNTTSVLMSDFESAMNKIKSDIRSTLSLSAESFNSGEQKVRGMASQPRVYSSTNGATRSFDVPEFATGGSIFGDGLAVLHDNEYVVNSDMTQQLGDFLHDVYTPAGSDDYIEMDVPSGGNYSSAEYGSTLEVNIAPGAFVVEVKDAQEIQNVVATFRSTIAKEVQRAKEKDNMRNFRPLKEGAIVR